MTIIIIVQLTIACSARVCTSLTMFHCEMSGFKTFLVLLITHVVSPALMIRQSIMLDTANLQAILAGTVVPKEDLVASGIFAVSIE